jgi:hypothetical protein
MKTFKFKQKGPDVVAIKSIQNIYSSVIFPHRLHSEMSKISGGCIQCHHYNTSAKLHKCRYCHEKNRKRDDISKPDLKGAYHQQCMDCHREWSHKIGCNTCHKSKIGNNKTSLQKEKARIVKAHEQLDTPDKIVYTTKLKKGSKVTFFHKEHVELFGFVCSDCHKNEVCVKCHDAGNSLVKKANQIMSASSDSSSEYRHRICRNCHETNKNCAACHRNKVAQPFNHEDATRWKLNRYHKNISCKACHGNKKRFTKLNTQCGFCHSDWNSDNFNHDITGIILSEDHTVLDCEDCHVNRNFSANPSCDNCHDNKSFPNEIPGKLLKVNRDK